MNFNLTRHVMIPLSREECMHEMRERVNNRFHSFLWFPLTGRYRFKSIHSKRFKITRGFWSRGPVIEGFVKEQQEDCCRVDIRLMPPLLLWYFFLLFPLFVFGIMYQEQEGGMLLGFLFVFELIIILNIIISYQLIRRFDGILRGLHAEKAAKPFDGKYILRKLGLYLLVAIFYIALLFVMGKMLSGS